MAYIIILDSRLKGLQTMIWASENVIGNIEIYPTGGAGIRTAGSAVFSAAMTDPHPLYVVQAGVCDLMLPLAGTNNFYFPFSSTDEVVDHLLTLYTELELAFYKSFNRGNLAFAELVGVDLAAYPRYVDVNIEQQEIINQSIPIINGELTGVNKRNHMPSLWLSRLVHRYRCKGKGKPKTYYDFLTDGVHLGVDLQNDWVDQLLNLAWRVS